MIAYDISRPGVSARLTRPGGHVDFTRIAPDRYPGRAPTESA